jgi:tetratricopeptide (TPR) repeat protein
LDGWTLAIDFGTSNTVVAIKDQHGLRAVEFPGEQPQPYFPSVVFVGDDGRLISGIAAYNNRLIQPRRYFAAVKRAVTDRRAAEHIAGNTYPVVELVAAVLRAAKSAAMNSRPDPTEQPARTALTHPVSWEEDQVEILCQAAELAGLSTVTTYQEPVAAAFNLYQTRFEPGEYIAVYDLGGGTFDAALLQRVADEKTAGGLPPPAPYRVVDTMGDPQIGGERFDDMIYAMLDHGDLGDAPPWQALRPENAPDRADEGYVAWLIGWRELRQRMIVAKIDLSSRTETALYIPGTRLPHTITRDDLENELRTDLETTVETLSSLIHGTQLTNNDIAHVALVGGSSQIPMVRNLLAERAGFDAGKVSAPAAAQTVVALGAAALVGVKPPETEAEQAFNAGEESARYAKWKAAEAAYQHAIACNDDVWSPRAAYRLGRIRTQNPPSGLLGKKYQPAIDAYRSAITYRDSDWAARSALALANLMLETKRLDEAGVFFDNAVHMNHPEVSPEAAFHLGLLHVRRGDWRSAEDAWQTAIDHNDPNWAPHAAYELGSNRRMRKNHLGARDAWQIAMTRFSHPDWSPRAACELGDLLRDKGRHTWRLAKDVYEKAIDDAYQRAIDSGHREWRPRAAFELGLVREKRRDWQGAADMYQRAMGEGHPTWSTKAAQRKSAIKRHL